MVLNRIAIWSAGLALLAVQAGAIAPARAEIARQDGTPIVVGTPAATPPAGQPAATTEPAAPDAVAGATAVPTTPPVTTDVVTLVAWYVNDPSGEFINILPIAIDQSQVATEQAGSASIGTAEFPENAIPTLSLGETEFDTYPRSESDIPERWTWFDDFEGARPATLVMQVSGRGGPFDRYYGTATFISRDEGGVGGVIVFALRPPALEEAPASDDAAAADGTTTDGEAAVEPEADVEAPTNEIAEPAA